MEAIRIELSVPFWCSFSDFSSLNLKRTYPFPPLTTLFGLILNAMGKPAVHMFSDNKKVVKELENEYLDFFNKLNFSIIIKEKGELIEDYTNIHKGNRNIEKYQNDLKEKINAFIKNNDFTFKKSSDISKYDYYIYMNNKTVDNKKYEKLDNELSKIPDLHDLIINYWNEYTQGYKGYEGLKYWISTQIKQEKIINPVYVVYIKSDDEKLLENVYNYLKHPLRPLYLGESDDVVDTDIKLVNISSSISSRIDSVLPGMYPNSELENIPVNLKYNKDTDEDNMMICSIPNGKLDKEISCYNYGSEYFVFF